MASKRPRDEAPTATPEQSIEERDDGQHLVKNSPYGTSRSQYGWGTPFQPAKKLLVKGYPNVYIGTASLNCVPGKDRDMSRLMQQYQKKFTALEHCATYHKINDASVWEKWKSMLGKGDFKITIKANQYLTHVRFLEMDSDTQSHINTFFVDRCAIMGDRLGAVLIQLPPRFANSPAHLDRLRALALAIPSTVKIAVEFRHTSWFTDEVYDVLREAKWALVCSHNYDTGESPFVDTGAGFAYVRLHGAAGVYVGDYGKAAMTKWAGIISRYAAANPGCPFYCFFNNNESHINNLTSSVVDATFLPTAFESMGDAPVVTETEAVAAQVKPSSSPPATPKQPSKVASQASKAPSQSSPPHATPDDAIVVE